MCCEYLSAQFLLSFLLECVRQSMPVFSGKGSRRIMHWFESCCNSFWDVYFFQSHPKIMEGRTSLNTVWKSLKRQLVSSQLHTLRQPVLEHFLLPTQWLWGDFQGWCLQRFCGVKWCVFPQEVNGTPSTAAPSANTCVITSSLALRTEWEFIVPVKVVKARWETGG